MSLDTVQTAAKTERARPSASKAWLRALELTARIDEAPSRTLPAAIEAIAERTPDAPALISEAERFTFGELVARARRYARWAQAQGLQPGDVVGLMMPNRPEYMAIWLGLSRVGVVTALINTNLVGPSLAHCVRVAGLSHVIVASTLADALAKALGPMDGSIQIWAHGEGDGRRIDLVIDSFAGGPLTDAELRPVTLNDGALLIYTSGTTGLPKAARVSHHRLMMWSHWFAGMMGVAADDRLYNCLPMYHSTGGVVATGSLLVVGGSVVLRERFSAGRFWADIAALDCTVVQYIGELCRYLLKAPPHPAERAHHVRLFCGNGLSGDVWTPFQVRFGIPRVLEFYASTEGNVSLFNAEGRPGAIGRLPRFLAHRSPVVLIRTDLETGAPLRGADDLCVACTAGEVGEAVGRIGVERASRFEGYTDAEATERKILRDVLAPGDRWMRTGDLMRLDAQGFYYFVDRVGDSFRWKGENVATGEVAEAIAACPGVEAVSVYGVGAPGAEGKAGMAAIVPGAGFDTTSLRDHLASRLPDYARPVFLRLVGGIASTETFKQKTRALAEAGYDPGRIDDPLYVDDRDAKAYVRLDAAMFDRIRSGAFRL